MWLTPEEIVRLGVFLFDLFRCTALPTAHREFAKISIGRDWLLPAPTNNLSSMESTHTHARIDGRELLSVKSVACPDCLEIAKLSQWRISKALHPMFRIPYRLTMTNNI